MGKLRVILHKAKNLMAADINGKSDPYCLFTLRSGGPTYRSHTKQKTLDPVWHEEIPALFFQEKKMDALIVRVFDQDACNKDDPLGDITIPLGNAFTGICWYVLDNAKHGRVKLEIIFEDVPNTSPEEAAASVAKPQGSFVAFSGPGMQVPNVNVPYEVHYDALAGLATAGKQNYRRFMCYQVTLDFIPKVFGSVVHGWNEKYDKAQKIFGSNIQAPFIRGAIHVQHATLYKKSTAEKGTLHSGYDFFRLFNYGVRERTPCIFTYVLMDKKFNFSETGASFFKDFMSKHAMHSNASEKVRYAGEFLVHQEPDGTYTLMIDNGSGTYAPKKDHLPLLEAVFKQNFPAVKAIDWESPTAKGLKEEIKKKQVQDWGKVSE